MGLSTNPDGNYGKRASWDADATPIRAVEAAWFDGVTVMLPSLGSNSPFDNIKIKARCDNRDRTWSVEIDGGNTNRGNADRYEFAIRDYTRAVEIARMLEAVLAERPEFWALGPDDVDITNYIVMGEPDYVLALYLLVYEPGDIETRRFAYERYAVALPAIREETNWPRLDLVQLRERATLLARQLHERDVLEAEIAAGGKS